MLEARIRKNYPEVVKKYFPNPIDLTLSLSHILKCSYYNQGCDGGYAYLVLKFLNEFELLHEKCFSHDSCEKKCSDKNLEKLHFSVSDYKYNGGSYGKCSEEVILNEVYHNGPIVVSLEPDYSFMFYKSGIYQSPHSNWMSNKLSKPEWQKVDHSVVLVGWGEEMVKGEFVKYWILQNSWGGYWGESGYLKFIRGIDHLGIESTCESGVPIVIEN
jgi:cathepsin C